MYNYDYKLPVIVSTYKSDYGKGRKDIFSHDTEFLDLFNYSLSKINKSIEVYEQVIKELHDISIHSCNPIEGKISAYHEIIMRNLNIILDKLKPNELELITIEYYFIDRKEKLEIVKSRMDFDNDMRNLVKKARDKNQFRKKKKQNV